MCSILYINWCIHFSCNSTNNFLGHKQMPLMLLITVQYVLIVGIISKFKYLSIFPHLPLSLLTCSVDYLAITGNKQYWRVSSASILWQYLPRIYSMARLDHLFNPTALLRQYYSLRATHGKWVLRRDLDFY